MDRPTALLAQQVQETCPQCRANVAPVVTEQTTPTLLTAAYRCVMCRTDFTSVWRSGYVRDNQPELPYSDPITSNVLPTTGTAKGDWQTAQPLNNLDNVVGNRTDGLCQKCLAQPGTPHAMACPYYTP